MQVLYFSDVNDQIQIPNENSIIYDDIRWGKAETLFTPAFWYSQSLFMSAKNDKILDYKIGSTFQQEVVACMLGGHGIPSEVGNAKFNQFLSAGFFERNKILIQDIADIMLVPVSIRGKEIKYRFAAQKTKYIYDAMIKISNINEEKLNDLELRKFLITINGIGPKTASWIVRNHRHSNEVAILDIHIHRAGILAGFFNFADEVEKNYFEMEDKFLKFCNMLKIEASKLDAIIWRVMKTLNDIALSQISEKKSMMIGSKT